MCPAGKYALSACAQRKVCNAVKHHRPRSLEFQSPKRLNFSLLELCVNDWVWNRGLCMHFLHCRNILQLHRSAVYTHIGITNLPFECTSYSLSYSLPICTPTKYVSRVLISQLLSNEWEDFGGCHKQWCVQARQACAVLVLREHSGADQVQVRICVGVGDIQCARPLWWLPSDQVWALSSFKNHTAPCWFCIPNRGLTMKFDTQSLQGNKTPWH